MAKRKDVIISLGNAEKRAEIEAQRGIYRDEQGRIIRSKQWLRERIAFLQGKIEDNKQRIKNLQKEIKQRQKELNS